MFNKNFVSVVFIMLLVTSCNFYLPTTEQSKELGKRGTFASGTPAWVPRVSGVSRDVAYAGGTVSSSVTASDPVVVERRQRLETNTPYLVKKLEDSKKDNYSDNRDLRDLKPKSPLEKIESSCPGLSTRVESILNEVNRDKRLKQYRALTSSCSNSSELWTWYAKDLYAAKKLDAAISALERGVVLDSQNKEARELLVEYKNAKQLEPEEVTLDQ